MGALFRLAFVLFLALAILLACPASAEDAKTFNAPWSAKPDGLYDPEGNQVAKAIERTFWQGDLTRKEKRALIFAIVGVAADIATTKRGLDRGCKEGNPIYGKDPSTTKLVGVGVVQLGLLYWVMGRDQASHHKDGWLVGGIRLGAAAWNSQQDCRK